MSVYLLYRMIYVIGLQEAETDMTEILENEISGNVFPISGKTNVLKQALHWLCAETSKGDWLSSGIYVRRVFQLNLVVAQIAHTSSYTVCMINTFLNGVRLFAAVFFFVIPGNR